jgi:hypothetical protein
LLGHRGQVARGVALERRLPGPSGAARAAAARLGWAARVAAAVRVAEAVRVAAVQVAVAATAETGNPGGTSQSEQIWSASSPKPDVRTTWPAFANAISSEFCSCI